MRQAHLIINNYGKRLNLKGWTNIEDSKSVFNSESTSLSDFAFSSGGLCEHILAIVAGDH